MRASAEGQVKASSQCSGDEYSFPFAEKHVLLGTPTHLAVSNEPSTISRSRIQGRSCATFLDWVGNADGIRGVVGQKYSRQFWAEK